MRRQGEDVLLAGENGPIALPAPPEEIIAALEPFATEERVARIKGVLSKRLASVVVVVDSLHDPHNGAAIVRSCDAFGIQYLHAIERLEPFAAGRSVARGSQKWIDVVRHPSSEDCLAALRDYELVATHPDGDLLPEDLAKLPKVALVLGNEQKGIAPEVRAACKRAVRVPMVGFVESLNVSVTAAILMHAATRGRSGDLDPATARMLYARGLFLSVSRAEERFGAVRARGSG
ncbi:MAG: TrmH family RNA methyltransferase [Polyangiales bacterium]